MKTKVSGDSFCVMLEHDGLGADESHGTVVDMMGEPIIGANVVESGNKTVGTITDSMVSLP